MRFFKIRRSPPLIAAGLMLALGAGPALAEWPERNVTIMVHSGAGSSTDVMARTFARALTEATGENVVVTVRGRDTLPALVRAEPDGYTLATHTRSLLGDIASGASSYTHDDIQWIERLLGETYIFAVRSDSPYTTAEELFAAAKENPGSVTMSTYRSRSTHQLAALRLNAAAGAEFNIVPYDSGSETVVALLGGNVDVVATNPSNLLQHVEAGTVRGLVVTSDERLDLLPDVPTALELGLGVESYHWRGIIGSAEIPAEIVAEISDAFDEAIVTDVWQQYLSDVQLQDLSVGPEMANEMAKKELMEVDELLDTVSTN